MRAIRSRFKFSLSKATVVSSSIFAAALALVSQNAQAVPSFARQTGQNCVACHAGGQFPELTPYGRMFKLTGYTIGERTIPLSGMGLIGYTKTRSTTGVDNTASTFPKNGAPALQSGSVFVAGKITDNLGIFGQWTYNNYSGVDGFTGHSQLDNTELRYADRFISPANDLIVGAIVNNNPSMQDVWNSTPAWGYPYVSSAFAQKSSAAPIITALGQSVAGYGAYAYWNKTVYAELSMYQTANRAWSIFSSGVNNASTTKLKGGNPYWRLALTKEWGAHNAMLGVFGMTAKVYPDATAPEGETSRRRDFGIDSQYQYILDPHTITAQASYIREKSNWAAGVGAANTSDTLNQLKLKATYIYRAKYGASLSYQKTSGDTDSGLYTAGGNQVTDNLSGNPGARVWIPEVFWTPVQYVRIGAQYWHYTQFNGAKTNYDGFNREAKANDTLFVYVWGAY
jgi:hypothetical protein